MPRLKSFNLIFVLTAGIIVVISVVIYISTFKTSDHAQPRPFETTPKPLKTPIPTQEVGKLSKFTGTIKTGEQLGEIKSYCPDGLYLVADEGSYLVNQTRMLLLQARVNSDDIKMLSDQKYVGKRVNVTGKYPAQEVFCEALTCACEDYILVERIEIAE